MGRIPARSMEGLQLVRMYETKLVSVSVQCIM